MYQDPKAVRSPKDKVKSVEVIYDAGPVESSWSVARLKWGDSPPWEFVGMVTAQAQ